MCDKCFNEEIKFFPTQKCYKFFQLLPHQDQQGGQAQPQQGGDWGQADQQQQGGRYVSEVLTRWQKTGELSGTTKSLANGSVCFGPGHERRRSCDAGKQSEGDRVGERPGALVR